MFYIIGPLKFYKERKMWQSGEMCGNNDKMEKCDKMRPMETHWLHLHISKIHLSAMCLLAFRVGWLTQFQSFEFCFWNYRRLSLACCCCCCWLCCTCMQTPIFIKLLLQIVNCWYAALLRPADTPHWPKNVNLSHILITDWLVSF